LKDLDLFECQDLINIHINRALTIAEYYHLEIPNLETMMDMADIYFLMVLCPHMEYFRNGFIINMDVESFVREILHKIYLNRMNIFVYYVFVLKQQMIKP
jgi:hypothetical protein